MSDSKSAQQSFREIQWWVWLILLVLIGLAVGLFWGLIYAIEAAWNVFTDLDKTVSIAIIAGFFTVLTSTITVMVGRYFEGKREQAELHRDKKIAMYDEFITRIFHLFSNTDEHTEDTESELVEFLRDNNRKFLLWSNPGVIRAYSEWRKTLAGQHNAQTVLTMEKFFLAVRRDLGHSNRGIKQGDTIGFLLRHTDFFLEQVRSNPNLTLTELAQREKNAGLEESDA